MSHLVRLPLDSGATCVRLEHCCAPRALGRIIPLCSDVVTAGPTKPVVKIQMWFTSNAAGGRVGICLDEHKLDWAVRPATKHNVVDRPEVGPAVAFKCGGREGAGGVLGN